MLLGKYVITCFILLSLTMTAHAEDKQTHAIRIYLNQGKPEQAISTARKLLGNESLSNEQRKSLFELILEAQLTIIKARHYEDVTSAVDTIKTLLKEFPEHINEPQLLWQITELHWNQDNLEAAQADILDLQNRYPTSAQAQQSWLMLGKIHYIHKNYAEARNSFLRYAVYFPEQSAQGQEVRMWTALIDYAEERYATALKTLNKIFKTNPHLITSQDSIYSRYIQLLHIQGENKLALTQARAFLATYKTSTHTPEVRLLLADLELLQPHPNKEDIIKSYNLIANAEPDTYIGKQAFMRQLMLHMQDKTSYTAIKPAIIALKRIANKNQMSDIEDEALLDEARLWHKVAIHDPKHSPKQATYAALQGFLLVSKSKNTTLKKQAETEGQKAFVAHLQTMIKQQAWNDVVDIWRTFTSFQPKPKIAKQLYFDVAKSLRLSFEYQAAESMFETLHQLSTSTVWGDKVMLELAKLWRDRGDKSGVRKIMRWLDNHEYTIYKPEMLLVVAQIQLQAKQASIASHTLTSISVSTLSNHAQQTFWKTSALVAQALSRWHMAAQAWQTYTAFNVDDHEQALLNQANARFKAGEFEQAEKLYQQTPEHLRNSAWAYHYSIAQLKNGKWNQATTRLTELKNKPEADIYTSMAALTLAERKAKQLLENSL